MITVEEGALHTRTHTHTPLNILTVVIMVENFQHIGQSFEQWLRIDAWYNTCFAFLFFLLIFHYTARVKLYFMLSTIDQNTL